MQNQINNFLETAREYELRTIIDKAVIFGQSKYAKDTSRYLRISKIPSQ
ncbi:1931_t:CDS:2, partial [Scutellospora calospora]